MTVLNVMMIGSAGSGKTTLEAASNDALRAGSAPTRPVMSMSARPSAKPMPLGASIEVGIRTPHGWRVAFSTALAVQEQETGLERLVGFLTGYPTPTRKVVDQHRADAAAADRRAVNASAHAQALWALIPPVLLTF